MINTRFEEFEAFQLIEFIFIYARLMLIMTNRVVQLVAGLVNVQVCWVCQDSQRRWIEVKCGVYGMDKSKGQMKRLEPNDQRPEKRPCVAHI